MSKPGDFDRLDDATRPGAGRFEAFKANVAAQTEYREAYEALRARDPKAAEGVPHPDAPDLDPKEALARIQGLGGALRADPGLNLKT